MPSCDMANRQGHGANGRGHSAARSRTEEIQQNNSSSGGHEGEPPSSDVCQIDDSQTFDSLKKSGLQKINSVSCSPIRTCVPYAQSPGPSTDHERARRSGGPCVACASFESHSLGCYLYCV